MAHPPKEPRIVRVGTSPGEPLTRFPKGGSAYEGILVFWDGQSSSPWFGGGEVFRPHTECNIFITLS